MIPDALVGKKLERKPPFGIVMRYFLVECAVHGQQLVRTLGHHVTSVPKNRERGGDDHRLEPQMQPVIFLEPVGLEWA
jgi:hypothetical protein